MSDKNQSDAIYIRPTEADFGFLNIFSNRSANFKFFSLSTLYLKKKSADKIRVRKPQNMIRQYMYDPLWTIHIPIKSAQKWVGESRKWPLDVHYCI